MLDELFFNTLSATQKTNLQRPNTMEELHLALKQIPGTKSHGLDGLQMIFIQKYWDGFGGHISKQPINYAQHHWCIWSLSLNEIKSTRVQPAFGFEVRYGKGFRPYWMELSQGNDVEDGIPGCFHQFDYKTSSKTMKKLLAKKWTSWNHHFISTREWIFHNSISLQLKCAS